MKEETQEEIVSKLVEIRKEYKRLEKELAKFEHDDILTKMKSCLGKFYKNTRYSRESDECICLYLTRVDGINNDNNKLLSTTVHAYKYTEPKNHIVEIKTEDSFDPFYNYGEDEDRNIEISKEEFDELYNFALEELNKRNKKQL